MGNMNGGGEVWRHMFLSLHDTHFLASYNIWRGLLFDDNKEKLSKYVKTFLPVTKCSSTIVGDTAGGGGGGGDNGFAASYPPVVSPLPNTINFKNRNCYS